MKNPVAKYAWRFNTAKIFTPKKGKGSYSRKNQRND